MWQRSDIFIHLRGLLPHFKGGIEVEVYPSNLYWKDGVEISNRYMFEGLPPHSEKWQRFDIVICLIGPCGRGRSLSK